MRMAAQSVRCGHIALLTTLMLPIEAAHTRHGLE